MSALAGGPAIDLAPPNEQPRDRFGVAVAIGSPAILGSVPYREPGLTSVTASFVPDGSGGWMQGPFITQGLNIHGDAEGSAMAADGTTVILGAPGYFVPSVSEGRVQRGRVRIMRMQSDGSLTQLYVEETSENYSAYGASVATGGGWAIAGRPGSATQWFRLFKIVGDTVTPGAWNAGHNTLGLRLLGRSVATNGDWAAIGAVDDGRFALSGIVVMLQRNANDTWVLANPLTSPQAFLGERFGASLAMRGDTLAVGAPAHGHADELGRGTVFIYRLINSEWQLEAELEAPIDGACEGFGRSVVVDGDRLAVGAVAIDENLNDDERLSAVFVYERSGSEWTHTHTFTAPALFDLGAAVDMRGGLLAAGAPGFSLTEESFEGRVRLFQLVQGDANGDGIVDGADLAIVLGQWGPNPGSPGDLNGDGVVDGADLTIVLGNWS